LKNAARTGIQVEEFRRTLRRSLRAQAASDRGGRLALAVATVAAVAFAASAVLFVLDPSLATALHASLFTSPGASGPAAIGNGPETAATAAGAGDLADLLVRADATPQKDLAFVEQWYRSQSRPVEVKAVSAEKILALRQIELADGRRVVVLTEIGGPPTADGATIIAAGNTF